MTVNLADLLSDVVVGVTKQWCKLRKAEERATNAFARRYEAMTRTRHVSIRDVAFEVMREAYLKASSNNTLPAHARQIMYAARPLVQERTDKQLDDKYFTQTLLPDYLAANPDATAGWDVVFDARGHFTEPHSGQVVPLGTIEVRHYLADVPEHSFGAVLFIEKEGFLPLFKAVDLAERYDLAVMSTKGMSVTASRQLVDRICHELQIPLLVLHDFDKSGFSILGTLQRTTRRYQFENPIRVIDLGLRLADVQEHDLPSEAVAYGQTNPESNLRTNGATAEEIEFLCSGQGYTGYAGRRVELNAFASADLVSWIEAKLEEHRVKKVVPGARHLADHYRAAWGRCGAGSAGWSRPGCATSTSAA